MDEQQNATVPGDPFAPTVGLLGLIRILLRWSFIVAPLVALSLWLAINQTEDINPEYTAEAAMLVIGPSEVLTEDPETGVVTVTEVNPLSGGVGGLSTFARVVGLSLSNSSVKDLLIDEGLSPDIGIGSEPRGTILRMTAASEDEAIASETINRLTQLVNEEIKTRQDAVDAPETNRITAQLIGIDVGGGPDYGARNRLRIAIAAVGLALSGASAFFFEGLLQLWKRRKERNKAAATASILPALPAGGPPVDRLANNKPETVQDLRLAERETLVSTLHLQTGNEQVAEAIAAEAFLAATEVWERLKVTEPVEWLYGHAMFQAWAQPESDRTSQHPVDHNLWTTVQSMSQETRAVLALAHVAEFTNPRIAGALDMRLETVQKHRADASEILAGLSGGRSVDETLKASRRTAGLGAGTGNGNGTGATAAESTTEATDSPADAVATDKKPQGSTKTKQPSRRSNSKSRSASAKRGSSANNKSRSAKRGSSTNKSAQEKSNGQSKNGQSKRNGKPNDPGTKR